MQNYNYTNESLPTSNSSNSNDSEDSNAGRPEQDSNSVLSCNLCSYSTTSTSDLNQHMSTHILTTDEDVAYQTHLRDCLPAREPLVCGHCLYQTRYFGDLKRHRRKHFDTTGEEVISQEHLHHLQPTRQPLKCGRCSYSTTSWELLEEHMDWHAEFSDTYGEFAYKNSKSNDSASENKVDSVVKDASGNGIAYRKKIHDSVTGEMMPIFRCFDCRFWTSSWKDLGIHSGRHSDEKELKRRFRRMYRERNTQDDGSSSSSGWDS